MGERRIECSEADALRVGLRPLSSITNWVGGRALDPELPPHTATTWGHREDDTEVMREVLDADGCRHYRIEGPDERGVLGMVRRDGPRRVRLPASGGHQRPCPDCHGRGYIERSTT